ncbi:PQQ-binding-like beta-propeller repeat protein [Danxiaibacter flavus]|uniref:PQQ-binding-like beta-propeller repeat protein n=1 Tax=Danxiaibacter flavus TaxID=3049108 RepID=A0ABV3Z9C6_9BACT|nr:PQQ-binding-like beta-propeller repeat protein [Chitinophagaceae bacterium DXS]
MKKNVLLAAAVTLSIAAQAQQGTTVTTSMFQDKNRSIGHFNPASAIGFTEHWKFKTGGRIFSSPAIYKDCIFIGSEDGNLYAVQETGQLKWKFKTGGAVHSSPAVSNGTVYFGSFDGNFYAVDITSGKMKWKFKTGGEKWIGGKGYFGLKPDDLYTEDLWDFFISSPLSDNNVQNETIYFGSSDGNVYAVNAKDGTLKWKFATNGVIHTSPLLYKNTIYIGSWDTYMYAIDASSGKAKWKFKTGDKMPMSGIQASATVYNDLIYFGARDAFFYALNATSGEVVWKYPADGSWILSTAAAQDGVIYVGTSDTFLMLALDARTGQEKRKFKTCGYVYSSPVIAGNTAFFGDFTGKFYGLSLADTTARAAEFNTSARLHKAGTVLKNDTLNFMYKAQNADLSFYAPNKKVMDEFYTLGPIVSSPVIRDSTIYFGSADGYLYSLDIVNKVTPLTPGKK